jgi:hypothetical protein
MHEGLTLRAGPLGARLTVSYRFDAKLKLTIWGFLAGRTCLRLEW